MACTYGNWKWKKKLHKNNMKYDNFMGCEQSHYEIEARHLHKINLSFLLLVLSIFFFFVFFFFFARSILTALSPLCFHFLCFKKHIWANIRLFICFHVNFHPWKIFFVFSFFFEMEIFWFSCFAANHLCRFKKMKSVLFALYFGGLLSEGNSFFFGLVWRIFEEVLKIGAFLEVKLGLLRV